MPELPEVEIVRRSLNKNIKQKRVKKVIVRNRNLRFKIPMNFADFLRNLKVVEVKRFSKYLILYLSNKSYCLFHLGMSGTFHIIYDNKKKNFTNTSFYNSPFLPKKHNHVIIIFENFKVIYNDPRRFGFIQIIKNNSQLKDRFKHLGPEPFDSKFNKNYLFLNFKNKNKNIKDFLIDQKFVSGIGNIYASEILFLSKIDPSKKAKLLSKEECKKIVIYTEKVLKEAINKGGSSIRDFRNVTGAEGKFQKFFKVYQREGLSCMKSKCEGIIEKKVISNRSSFFCNICQK